MANHGELELPEGGHQITHIKVYLSKKAQSRNGENGDVRFSHVPNHGFKHNLVYPRHDDLCTEIRRLFKLHITDSLHLSWSDPGEEGLVKFNTDDELFEAIPRMERDGQSLIIYAEARSTITILRSFLGEPFCGHGEAFLTGFVLGGCVVLVSLRMIVAIVANNIKSGLKR